MHQLLQAVGTTPVGPLSPLFIDLRPTSIRKKNTQPLGRPTTLVGPGSWSLVGVNGPTILDCQAVVWTTFRWRQRAPSSVWFYSHFFPLLCDPGVLDHPSMGPSLPPSSVSWTRGPPQPFGRPGVGNALRAGQP